MATDISGLYSSGLFLNKEANPSKSTVIPDFYMAHEGDFSGLLDDQDVGDGSVEKVYVDGELVVTKERTSHTNYALSSGATPFYFSDPWYDPADASLKNLVFSPTTCGDDEVSKVFCNSKEGAVVPIPVGPVLVPVRVDSCSAVNSDISGLYSGGLFINDEQSPSRGTWIDDFNMEHNGDFSLSFSMIINSAPERSWENIFHKGATNHERGPGLWLHPTVLDDDASTYGIHLSTATTTHWNPATDLALIHGLTIQPSTWYRFTFTYENVYDGSIEKIYFDGLLEVTRFRRSATNDELSSNDTPFYFSDPWHHTADVTLKNLMFSATTWSQDEIDRIECASRGTITYFPAQEISPPPPDVCATASTDYSGLYKSSLFREEGQCLTKGKTVSGFDMEHNGDFSMAFWMYIHSAPERSWENVFHKGTTNQERGPGVWLHPSVHDKSVATHGVHISAATETNWNPWTDLGMIHGLEIEEAEWHHYVLTYANVDGGSVEKVYVDDVLEVTRVRESETNAALSGAETPFYISDPWHDSANVTLENLLFTPTTWTDDEVSTVYCGAKDEIEPEPETCVAPLVCTGPTGYWWGDPHTVTFDGLRWDCQGRGEFVAVKSLDSDLMVQGRFITSVGSATVASALVFNTGEPGVPTIEIMVPDDATNTGCPHTYYVNGEEVPDILAGEGTGSEKVTVTSGGGRRLVFDYPLTGTRIEINVGLSHAHGCHMFFEICLPERRFGDERIIGLLGSPDGDQSNNWMKSSDGTGIPFGGSYGSNPYNYCTAEWCIDYPNFSMFSSYTDTKDFDYYNDCQNTYEDDGLQDAINNLPENVKEICAALEDEQGCLIDAATGNGEEDANNAGEVEEIIKQAPPPNPDHFCTGVDADIAGLMTSSLLTDDRQCPSKGRVIDGFDMKHNVDFSLAFWMTINAAPADTWENIFHKGSENMERGPGLWLHPSVHDDDVTTYGVHMSVATTANPNPWTDLGMVDGMEIEQDTWYHFTFTYENDNNGGSIEKVYVDGELELTKNRNSPTDDSLSADEVPFYFSDPWHDAADVTLNNLVFSPTVWTGDDVKKIFCATETLDALPGVEGGDGGGGLDAMPDPVDPLNPLDPVGVDPTNPVNPGVRGDPHFKTWTGDRYDFQGACDLVLLQNPGFHKGLGMDIHIRTKFTKQWSYISSAVLRIGDETLEVVGGENVVENYWINKVAMGDLSKDISGFKIYHKEVSAKQREFVVDLGSNDGQISIKTFKDFVRVDIEDGKIGSFVNSLGLMGAYGTGETLGRDQKFIADTNAFGIEWQVQASEAKLCAIS